jgi:pyruvate/2-oxoglutarate/acetoin dehydrogenase E1 component
MAEADLDGVIRSIAKTQHKVLMDAAKKRSGRLMELAAKAKDKSAKAQYKQTAKDTLLLAGAAARRMQITAENAADSYARAVKKATEDTKQAAEAEQAKLAQKAAKKAAKAPAKKAVQAKKAAKKSKA